MCSHTEGALSNLGPHLHNTTVRNILRRNHIDPAPIRGRAGMSWSQSVTLRLEVLEASGVFAARLSPFVRLWIALIHFSPYEAEERLGGNGNQTESAAAQLRLTIDCPR